MSGHSKWATIHRDKEKNDSKRGAAFTKMGHAITTAVRQGGGIGDPDMNFRLRLAIDKARAVNMPKENIQRAIDRATGAGGSALEEVLFEGFLPGGVAVMAEGLTDSKLRLAQQVREAIDRNGGTLGSIGSVSYLFSHTGEIKVKKNNKKPIDEQELEIIDMGVDDFENEGETLVIYCHKEKISQVKEKLEAAGYVIESVELIYKPLALVEVSDPETQEKIENILNKLDDIDEVSKVWTNYA